MILKWLTLKSMFQLTIETIMALSKKHEMTHLIYTVNLKQMK